MWPRARLALMTGLAFSLGLVLGLLVHLPGVSSPGQSSPLHHHRTRRHSPANPSDSTLEGLVRNSEKDTEDLTPNSYQSHNKQTIGGDPVSTSVTDLNSRIKQTYESIEALRSEARHKDLDVLGSKLHHVPLSQARGPGQTQRKQPPNTNRNVSKVNGSKQRGRARHKVTEDSTRHRSGHTRTKPPSLPDTQEEGEKEVVEGVYWAPSVDVLIPKGFGEREEKEWRDIVAKTKVAGLEEGCGRMQNRLVTLVDATRACARYRINVDQMQGEVYSYYLARLLGIHNIPPSVLAQPDLSDPRWTGVSAEVVQAEWNPDKLVVLTPWLTHLGDAYIPRELRKEGDALLPLPAQLTANRTLGDLQELVQWSDLVVFDYLTANVDRVVNNMFNQQWNNQMMNSPTHNLEKHSKTGLLVFLDNESGLFHSYRLLDKYAQYHNTLLKALCVFRKSTADAIKQFHKQHNIGDKIQALFEAEEPLWNRLPRMPADNVRTLQNRVADVYKQITACETKYPS